MTHTGPVDTIHVHQCISGFTQTESRCTGTLKLCEKLHELGYNNRVSRVALNRWNSKWSDVAEHLWLLGQHHQARVVVNIYAYSWGVGWGAVQLCRELKKRSITVRHLVSCDGVYRHWLWKFPALLARHGHLSPTIKIPSNVVEVTPFHQKQNRPQGHKIKGDRDFSGIIHESRLLAYDHQWIDDAPEFHDAALAAAEDLRRVN